MNRTSPRSSAAGLSLVEVLAAVAILGIAVTPMLGMLREGLVASRRVESLSRSLLLAESKYEELKARIQSPVPPYGYDVDYDQTAVALPPPDGEYRCTVVDDAAPALRTLAVTVWHDLDGDGLQDANEIAVSLDTRVADRY